MRIKKGDQVKVISGKDKGTTGAVLEFDGKNSKIKVAGVNISRHHKKPTGDSPEGGVVEKERFIDISNVMLVTREKKKDIVTRVRYRVDVKDKKKVKVRIATKTGKEV